MSEHEIPPPAAIPTPTFADISEATHELLLVIDKVQSHTAPTAYLISARSMIVAALGQAQAHYAVVEAQEAAAQQNVGAQ
jgi:heptaprenylglyceryl phosphate synthase